MQDWQYNDHYPTEADFSAKEIINRLQLNELEINSTMIDFARQCWAECAIKHDIKTGE